MQTGLLTSGQQVGDGDEEGRVRTGRGGCLVQGGDHAGVHAPVGEEFGDRAAAARVGGARVEFAVPGVGAEHGDGDGSREEHHEGERDTARAGPDLACGGRGRGGRERGLGGHSAAPWRVLGAVLWALPVASWGLVRSRSRSSSAMRWYDCSVAVRPPYVTSSKSRAAARSRSAWAGRGAAGFGGGLVGGAAGADVEEGAFLQGADEGSHAFLDGLVPVALGGVCLGGGAVVGGAARAVVEQGGRGGGPAARGAQTPPQGGHERDDGQDDDDQAQRAAGRGGRGGAEESVEPVPEGVEGALEEAGVVLVVHPLRQFAPGRLLRRVAWGGEGRLVGGARRRQHGGVAGTQQRAYGGAWQRQCENFPRPAHRISSPRWRRGRWSRGPGDRRRGPVRGRGPRGGCAGRCRGAR